MIKKIFKIFILILLTVQINAAELPFVGFAEYGLGSRTVGNIHKDNDLIFNEARIQLEYSKFSDMASFKFKADFIKDEYTDNSDIEIREANITLFPSLDWELKLGRQAMTWGTGDLVFVNDMFPKDWQSFFIGRDDEYLKYPITGINSSFFTGIGDFNFIIVPKFTPDRYITGERMSYWGMSGITGNIFQDTQPESKLENSEYFFRWSKNISAVEYALYAYKGFFKRPLGFDMSTMTGFFPELAVYGFSVRREFLGGIANIESGYYDSIDDRNGSNALVENSYIKTTVGFEKEIVKNLTGAVQYFSEWMQDYDEYKNSLGVNAYKKENHDWITLRLTLDTKKQTLIYSWFSYYSHAEKDWYMRPKITYKMSDQIQIVVGANIFGGKNDYTFFGQLEDNTNAYFRVRYSY